MRRASVAPNRHASDRLWSIMHRHDLTRNELAKLLHTSRHTFDKWLNAETIPHTGHLLWLEALERFPNATKTLLSTLKGVDI